MTEKMVGAYTPFTSNIDAEAKKALADAMEGFVGVGYEPVAVANQVVSGMNYAFFCNATPVYPGAPTYPAMVHVYRSLDGKSAITDIQRLKY